MSAGRSPLEAFAEAVGTTGPVAVAGGRTAWDVGGPLDEGARVVEAPAGVVEYVPAEMTVRVGAGTTLAELDATLAEAGQFVALPRPSAAGATVGGALAVGEAAMGEARWGPARDVLLEARYVSADGRLVKAGGPTVKNVSGYDLCRLLVGSLGTLGLLGEVVLRTRPRPQCARWFAGEADPWAVRDLLYRPSAVLWDATTTWVWLEGYEADVEGESVLLATEGLAEVDGPPALPPYRHRLDRASPADVDGSFVADLCGGLVHRDVAPPAPAVPSAVEELCRRIKHEFDPTGRLNPGRDPLRVAR